MASPITHPTSIDALMDQLASVVANEHSVEAAHLLFNLFLHKVGGGDPNNKCYDDKWCMIQDVLKKITLIDLVGETSTLIFKPSADVLNRLITIVLNDAQGKSHTDVA